MLKEEVAILKNVSDVEIPALIEAELLRLPLEYQAVAKLIAAPLEQKLVSLIDDALAKIVVSD
jgi:hypothetical protein